MKTLRSVLATMLLLVVVNSTKAQTPAVNTAINKVLLAYVDVKNALVTDNGVTTEAKAKNLYAQINAVQVKDMSAKQQGAWKGLVDKLSFDSRHISETDKVDHQREHFASLSKNMYAVLKAFPVNSTTIYLQYCPMKKSSWLSDNPAIENPYYGKEMPDCGSLKETLKAAK